ncbi:hypothetical protein C8J56DRAFT_954577 [Mycena floridula]|nr:hypothetical protein C8J56DRAFT_954577 [Mycena floridula]
MAIRQSAYSTQQRSRSSASFDYDDEQDDPTGLNRVQTKSKSVISLSDPISNPSTRNRRSLSISSLKGGRWQSSSNSTPPAPPLPRFPPTPAVEDMTDAERRIRQLHKVSRTLGESIEVLVNPEARLSSQEVARRSSKKVSRSRSKHRGSSVDTRTQNESTSTGGYFVPGQAPSSSSPPRRTARVPDIPRDSYQAQDIPRVELARSKSLTKGHRRKSSEYGFYRSDTPFLSTRPDEEDNGNMDVEYSYGSTVRKERRQGWSGEWNQENMGDVIQRLRNLK